MFIEIDPRVANDPTAHLLLDRILHKIDDGWHVWDTTHQAVLDEMEDTSWIRDSAQRVRDLLVASVRRDAWSRSPHGRSVRVTANPNNADEFTPGEADTD